MRPFELAKRVAAGASAASEADPHWANVVSLLHFDGADGSTAFSDQTGKSWTKHGSAQIDTAQSKVGGASGLFPGGGDYLTTPPTNDFNFGAGMFTVEAWVRITATPAAGQYATVYSYIWDSGASGHRLLINNSRISSFSAYGSGISTTGATPIALNTWTHLAVCRESGGAILLYVDGVLDAVNEAGSNAIPGHTSRDMLVAGEIHPHGYPQWALAGHIDELRITKGVARYLENFTPPVAPFPNY